MKSVKVGSSSFEALADRHANSRKRLEKKVAGILDGVRAEGDAAVIRFTKKFDGVELSRRDLRITESEISAAYQDIKPELVSVLRKIIRDMEKFYRNQKPASWTIKRKSGVELGEKFEPIEKVGVYVPSGTAPLVSSVYMSVLPASLAGVKRIILTSPPNAHRTIDPHILVMADLLKVKEIYKIGGAQAIGAMAFGTKTVPRVDKIVGPGNEYVTEAKRQVFGYCDIDMLAGPSEVLIIAGAGANIDYIKKDIEAQSEHHKGLAALVTPSKGIFDIFHKDNSVKGYVIRVRNLDEAVSVSNRIAPEHLELLVKAPSRILKKITNAGAIFLGEYSPVAVGDYVAGPSHVLPTGGTARFFSGLNLRSFVKSSHVISYSRKALESSAERVREIATLERMGKHWESVRVRCE